MPGESWCHGVYLFDILFLLTFESTITSGRSVLLRGINSLKLFLIF